MSTRFIRMNYKSQEEAIREITTVANSHLRDDAQPERWGTMTTWPMPSTTRPPTPANLKENVAGYSFISDSTNDLFYNFELPKTYKEGTSIKPVVAWSLAVGGAGSVKWGLEYIIQKPGAVFSQSCSTIYALVSATSSAFQYMTATFASITAAEIGSILLCRLFRDGGDASDNFGGNVLLLNFKCHILNDTSRGSQYEYDKFDH